MRFTSVEKQKSQTLHQHSDFKGATPEILKRPTDIIISNCNYKKIEIFRAIIFVVEDKAILIILITMDSTFPRKYPTIC